MPMTSHELDARRVESGDSLARSPIIVGLVCAVIHSSIHSGRNRSSRRPPTCAARSLPDRTAR